MPAPDTSGPKPVTDSSGSSSSPQPDTSDAQLSGQDGVSNDMSSMAIDRGLLGFAGTGPSSSPRAANSAAANPVTTDSDAEVMLRVKAGDEPAFSYLVQKYRRPLVGFMYRLCHNPATAEELAQEVFLRVYRSRTSYEASAKFSTWLYRI